MIIFLPSAKQMKCREEIDSIYLDSKTQEIVKYFSNLTAEEISKIFKISLENSFKELTRFKNICENKAKIYKAIELFDGLMYRNIKRENLLNKEKEYIEKNVYICTSLYGIVNSYDAINEYRLDFMQNIKINNKSLKQIWIKEYDGFVESKDDFILSLLSSEFEEVFSKNIRDKFIKPIFIENGRIHSTISKKARGKFLTYLVENNIEKISDLEKISFDGFKFKRKDGNKYIYEK